METNENGNYNQDERNFQNTESSNPAYRNEEKKEDSDDFHKYDNLSHSQDGERLDAQDGERIDRTGTDPNRYSNLASQDSGSATSLYNNEERTYFTKDYGDSEEDDEYDAEDISDEEYSDEEEELRNNEANRLSSNDDSEKRNSSPDDPFFTEGI